MQLSRAAHGCKVDSLRSYYGHFKDMLSSRKAINITLLRKHTSPL